VILLLVVIFYVVLIAVVVLLPFGAVGDELGCVATLEIATGVSGVSSPLLLKLVHRSKFPYKQGNLVVRNALVLLIRRYSKRRQSKLQRW
jgi:hypothetical protein